MRRVFAYLQLAPYPITIGEAHNTHRARSVHVHQNGAQNLSEVADDRVADALTYARAVPRPWSRAPPRSTFDRVAPSPYRPWSRAHLALLLAAWLHHPCGKSPRFLWQYVAGTAPIVSCTSSLCRISWSWMSCCASEHAAYPMPTPCTSMHTHANVYPCPSICHLTAGASPAFSRNSVSHTTCSLHVRLAGTPSSRCDGTRAPTPRANARARPISSTGQRVYSASSRRAQCAAAQRAARAAGVPTMVGTLIVTATPVMAARSMMAATPMATSVKTCCECAPSAPDLRGGDGRPWIQSKALGLALHIVSRQSSCLRQFLPYGRLGTLSLVGQVRIEQQSTHRSQQSESWRVLALSSPLQNTVYITALQIRVRSSLSRVGHFSSERFTHGRSRPHRPPSVSARLSNVVEEMKVEVVS